MSAAPGGRASALGTLVTPPAGPQFSLCGEPAAPARVWSQRLTMSPRYTRGAGTSVPTAPMTVCDTHRHKCHRRPCLCRSARMGAALGDGGERGHKGPVTVALGRPPPGSHGTRGASVFDGGSAVCPGDIPAGAKTQRTSHLENLAPRGPEIFRDLSLVTGLVASTR